MNQLNATDIWLTNPIVVNTGLSLNSYGNEDKCIANDGYKYYYIFTGMLN